MSKITVDKQGNRIMTDILTFGYLRQEIEKIHKILIPSEIKQLCFDYWFLNICDQWDTKSSEHDDIELDGQVIKSQCTWNDNWWNVFGCHSVSSGHFVWRLLFRFKDGTAACHIGIINVDKAEENPKYAGYPVHGHGVCWNILKGDFYDEDYFKNGISSIKKIKDLESQIKNIYIEMKIDLEERSLYYAINDEEIKAPYQLKENTSFRLIVTMPDDKAVDVELM